MQDECGNAVKTADYTHAASQEPSELKMIGVKEVIQGKYNLSHLFLPCAPALMRGILAGWTYCMIQ